MNSAPEISVIIPAYNVASFIVQTLESVLAQTFTNWECLVIDDGSADQTVAAASTLTTRDPRFRLLTQENAGVARARNAGLCQSDPRSPFVIFMDSDDLWLPDALHLLLTRLRDTPDAVGAHGLADMIDAEGQPLMPNGFAEFGRQRLGYDGRRIKTLPLTEPTTFASLAYTGRLFPPGLVLLRRAIVEQVGGFDPLCVPCEDLDLWIRVCRHGNLEFCNRIMLLYRRHGSNASSNIAVMRRQVRYVRAKTMRSLENTAAQRRLVRGSAWAWQVYKVQEKIGLMQQHLRNHDLQKASELTLGLLRRAMRIQHDR